MYNIIQILRSNEFYGVSETVEIAKGKHQLVNTFKGFRRKWKRISKRKL